MGQWFGRSDSGEEVIVYQCTMDEFRAGSWYEGQTYSNFNQPRLSIDANTVKEVTGKSDIMYKCSECSTQVEFADITFEGTVAVCNDCLIKEM